MQRDQVPLRESELEEPSGLGERNSERVPAATSEVTRGSHVTPVAPAADPTDPLASTGPLTLPPSWFPADGLESVNLVTEVSELADGSEFSYQASESSGEIIPPRPRDTVPSPPPCLEEYELNELPLSEDRPKTS